MSEKDDDSDKEERERPEVKVQEVWGEKKPNNSKKQLIGKTKGDLLEDE